MYGYPEQFIPASELEGYGAAPHGAAPGARVGVPDDREEVPAT